MTLQPRYLLATFMHAAELTERSTLTLQIHPVHNTCTVSAVNHEDALKPVQLHQITYEEHEYAMMVCIAPPDGLVRGVITNAYWKESPQQLLADLITLQPCRNHTRRLTNGTHTFNSHYLWSSHSPRRIVYGGGLHLCTPYTPKVETCSNCQTISYFTDLWIQLRSRNAQDGARRKQTLNPTSEESKP
ncbi:hypothetical protein MRX96_020242 [Rhipicephalus microplus]